MFDNTDSDDEVPTTIDSPSRNTRGAKQVVTKKKAPPASNSCALFTSMGLLDDCKAAPSGIDGLYLFLVERSRIFGCGHPTHASDAYQWSNSCAVFSSTGLLDDFKAAPSGIDGLYLFLVERFQNRRRLRN
jgi:hypothetical protein